MNELYTLQRGDAPLLVSIPHLGHSIPPAMRHLYTDVALTFVDTDWHLDRLYDFVSKELGATLLGANVSRYVIDLNRPSNDESLYPGQTTTGLCPIETFRGEPVYRAGCEPDPDEKQRRVAQYWTPYHDTLRAELARLRERHANVLLWEAHSIASVLPRLFDGKLPDLNLGTQDGRTAAPALQAAAESAAAQSGFTWIANGRFKGGYITRHFGSPRDGIHAIQLEMCQSTYMHEEAPFAYEPPRAERVQPVVRAMIEGALDALQTL
ncbi:N-formylglutamate deformylase [Paraburkholderia caribensis]|uniref:N-formylglutamate deformylase n=1 Tax=Paraburkholderia caribensis TaxID=75105 RepID=A0A9Q6WQU5_9BURK|nr:N-formylglutamate deformylase [Paraburkholderia caribensis]MCO4880548.1 N-formylglutamate deformylase [Paraburkholderia caribensis]PTB26197.1 N-formylglutamate deformylase [Paraburkholderia caribensis]QLB67294.1 N-formylglutamate deformylase [Paraburkholderia caribensis]